MGFISNDRSQQSFIGYTIDDFAKSDEKSRFVIQIISRLDLKTLFARFCDQGGDAYSPEMMLALWFYAYSQGITSTRKLEELCLYDTRYIYISQNLQPDHTTLSRFRKDHLDLLSEYFIQIVLMAEQDDLVDFKHIAIDGTKIKAKSSGKQSYKEETLKRKIEVIRKDIEQYMQRCNFVEQGAKDELDLDTLQAEKARLESLEKKLIERENQLKERKETLKPEHRKNHQINVVEPEARFMAKMKGPSYNAQSAVDTETHLIAANTVSDQSNDQHLFSPLHQQTQSTLSPDPGRAFTADSGYHSLDQLEYIEANKIDALIAEPTPKNRASESIPTRKETILAEKRKVERSDFTYHSKDDFYVCPNGDILAPISSQKTRTIYRAKQCQSCPLSSYCLSKKGKFKEIYRDYREELAEKMNHRMQSSDSKARMKARSTSVEPVFGNLKENLKFRRFHLSGLQAVKGEFNLMCIAHNLNVLFKLTKAKKRLAAAMYLKQQDLYKNIVLLWLVLRKIRANILFERDKTNEIILKAEFC